MMAFGLVSLLLLIASFAVAYSHAEETPSERANALVNAMSGSLVLALEKAGYTVRRFHSGGVRPEMGLRLRGVFADTDERNRVRRLLVGSDSSTPKMLLFVGVSDLARPGQPLYELANPPSTDSQHGPIKTMTSYSPLARFEMDRIRQRKTSKRLLWRSLRI